MLETAEEQGLLAAVAEGDRRAAESLVDGTYGQVFAALVRLTSGDRDLAADLTQETYRKAWRALERFDRRSRLSTWLYRIAYTTYLNHIRRPMAVQPMDDERIAEAEDPGIGQDAGLDIRQRAERLRRAVISLPDDLRFTVTARFWAELSVEEIARLEQVTGAAIRKRLKNAMARLRLTLGEDAV